MRLQLNPHANGSTLVRHVGLNLPSTKNSRGSLRSDNSLLVPELLPVLQLANLKSVQEPADPKNPDLSDTRAPLGNTRRMQSLRYKLKITMYLL